MLKHCIKFYGGEKNTVQTSWIWRVNYMVGHFTSSESRQEIFIKKAIFFNFALVLNLFRLVLIFLSLISEMNDIKFTSIGKNSFWISLFLVTRVKCPSVRQLYGHQWQPGNCKIQSMQILAKFRQTSWWHIFHKVIGHHSKLGKSSVQKSAFGRKRWPISSRWNHKFCGLWYSNDAFARCQIGNCWNLSYTCSRPVKSFPYKLLWPSWRFFKPTTFQTSQWKSERIFGGNTFYQICQMWKRKLSCQKCHWF